MRCAELGAARRVIMAEPPTEAMANASLERQPSAVTVSAEANRKMPPGRVRFMFKKYDTDDDGRLSLDELIAGFQTELKVDSLAPHVMDKLKECFEKVATAGDDGGAKAIERKHFARFYAEIMFRHFDKDNSGTLELAEVQEALKHLVKPDADGNRVMPVVAYPPEFTDDKGEVRLPMSWFWLTFSAME